MQDQNNFDVIIIGGSYAGLSSAMALGRSLKNVLLIDSGKPCNRYTPYSHNFITQDGEAPAVIAQKAREQVLRYPTVKFLEGLAVQGRKTGNGFEITTQSGEKVSARKLIFATGIRDIFPDIGGFEACWGKTLIHCPYCHGYEFKGKKTAIIANGEKAVHIASLVNNLTDHISVITSGKAELDREQKDKLQKHRINLIEKEISTVENENGIIRKLVFKDGTQDIFDVAYAPVPFEQHCTIPVSLGCGLTDTGHIQADLFQKTTVPGIYACGDNTSMMRSVAYAVATGNIAGAMVNHELTTEQF